MLQQVSEAIKPGSFLPFGLTDVIFLKVDNGKWIWGTGSLTMLAVESHSGI
jgi:hypothetical protein